MKKTIKKLAALLLAGAMTAAMSVAAFAAPTNQNLKVPNEEGHTYEVFQIFTGDLADGKLSNITWGKNGNGNGLVDGAVLDDLTAIGSTTADAKKADEILKALGMTKADLDDDEAFSKDVPAGTTVTVPSGYYIIKDMDGSQDGKDDAYSLLMIDVVGPMNLEAKMDTPEVFKKVTDVNDSTGFTEADQDSADYDIGDPVPYKLTATLAGNVSSYKKYHITFVDTLESGKFDAISGLTIKLGDIPIENGEGYTVSTTGIDGDVEPTVDGFKQTIEFSPTGEFLPTSLNGAKITVEFTATLGAKAAVGKAGNKNEVKLEYSNNPNDEQGGEEGTTPEDTVRVFTYKVDVHKIDPDLKGTDKSLNGANFTLYKKVPEGTVNAMKGSDIKNTYDTSVKADAIDGDSYYVEVGQKTGDATGAEFAFNGIDDGTYVLVETTIPAGYNAWDAVEFDVEAEHEKEADDPQLTQLTGGDLVEGEFHNTGIITTNIENHQGSTLPSTGGMGTTIFYVIGGILVLAAVIVLISKRRVQQ